MFGLDIPTSVVIMAIVKLVVWFVKHFKRGEPEKVTKWLCKKWGDEDTVVIIKTRKWLKDIGKLAPFWDKIKENPPAVVAENFTEEDIEEKMFLGDVIDGVEYLSQFEPNESMFIVFVIADDLPDIDLGLGG